MSYPHDLRIFSQATGSHAADDTFSPGEESDVYDDRADVQDGPIELERNPDGRPFTEADPIRGVRADAVAFLKDETKLDQIQLEQYAVVTWEDGSTSEAMVVGTRRLDGKVFLDWRKR